jgi:hypothetical protein
MKKGLAIALILIIIILLGYFASIIGMNDIRAKRAVAVGHTYLKEVYSDYKVVGEHCQGVDTDGDTYVSCDFRLAKGSEERIVNLQCPTISTSLLGSSCKESRYPAIK